MGVFLKLSCRPHHTHLLTEMLKLLLCTLVLLTILDCTQSGHIRDGRYDNYENMIDTTALVKSVQDTPGLVRVKREPCDQEGATACITTATQTYMDLMFEIDGENAVVKTVPEGEKPDYHERKTCNFILEAEKCFDKLKSCDIPADQFKKQETQLQNLETGMMPNARANRKKTTQQLKM